jgi:hypothetical protein
VRRSCIGKSLSSACVFITCNTITFVEKRVGESADVEPVA